jgi:hypothetical protein
MVNGRTIKERRWGRQYWFMTSKLHLLNLSIGFMLVAASELPFAVVAMGGGGSGGCYRFRNSWTEEGDESSKQANSSDRKRVFIEVGGERGRKQERGQRRRIPNGAVNLRDSIHRLFFMALPFTRRKTSSTILKKKEEKNISSLCFSSPLHQQSYPPVAS